MLFTSNFQAFVRHELFLLYQKRWLAKLIFGAIVSSFLFLNLVVFNFPYNTTNFSYSYALILSCMLFFPLLSLIGFCYEEQHHLLPRIFTWPVSTKQIFLGRFLAIFSLAGPLLILFWLTAFLALPWQFFDFGLLFAHTLSFLLAFTLLTSATLFWGTIIPAHYLASLACAGFLAILIFMGQIPFYTPFYAVLHFLAFFNHLENLKTGLLRSQDLAFFLGLSLLLSHLSLNKLQKMRAIKNHKFHNFFFSFSYLLCVVWLVLPWSVDLSAHKLNTLSPYSQTLLKNKPAPLYITYYSSPLPTNKPEVDRIWQLIKQYNRPKQGSYTKHVILKNDYEATKKGFYVENLAKNHFYSSAVVLEYQEKTIILSHLTASTELEFILSSKISQLIDGKKKLALITGSYRDEAIYSTLMLALQQFFDFTYNLEEAEAVFVLDDTAVSEAMSNYLFKANQAGKGLFIALSPIHIDLTQQEKPFLITKESPLMLKLFAEGLTFDRELVLSQNSLPMTIQAGQEQKTLNYPPLLQGHTTPDGQNKGQNKLWTNIKIPYSVALSFNSDWQPVASSNASSYTQVGAINLDANFLSKQNFDGPRQSFPLIALKKQADSFLYVAGSDALFTDFALLTNMDYNLSIATLLALQLSHQQELAELKIKTFSTEVLKKPVDLLTDSPKILLNYLILFFSVIVSSLLFFSFIKRRFL